MHFVGRIPIWPIWCSYGWRNVRCLSLINFRSPTSTTTTTLSDPRCALIRVISSTLVGSWTLVRWTREPTIKCLSCSRSLLSWRHSGWSPRCSATWRSGTTITGGVSTAWGAPLAPCTLVTHSLLAVAAACNVSLILFFLQGHETL